MSIPARRRARRSSSAGSNARPRLPASIQKRKTISPPADEKYGIRDEAGQAAFRNYVLSNLTAMRLYGILFARGRSAFAAEVSRLIKA